MTAEWSIKRKRLEKKKDIFIHILSCVLQMTILLRMDDKMNRQLTCPVSQMDTSMLLAQELVHFGFINEVNYYLSCAQSLHSISCLLANSFKTHDCVCRTIVIK